MAMQNLNENLANDLLWGAQEIGEAIGVNRRRAFHLLANGRIPARRVGKKWVASRAALHAFLASASASENQSEVAA